MHNGRLWRMSVTLTSCCGLLRELVLPPPHLEQPHRVLEPPQRASCVLWRNGHDAANGRLRNQDYEGIVLVQ
jgi:hypothetical protein